ncbi:hypothetical protein FACS189440_12190 [Bacteroidia bacterium]|nr:hypothetical protein FACS189423_09960 [Bacteroidia bacterium]GHT48471.1 hypothetical protein FACS189440_12190 [Bacteroidia bacterium]
MKLFLASFFTKDIAKLFENFANQELKGKTVTFIPTASKVEKMAFYVNSGRKAHEKLGLIVDELDVSTATQTEIAEKLQTNDFIYVTGGNTFFLLQELTNAYPQKLVQHAVSTCFAGGEFQFEKMNFFERAIIKRIAKTDKSVSQINEEAIGKFIPLIINIYSKEQLNDVYTIIVYKKSLK